ncbi:MAG: tetratricopeptide repeat protein [Candidatus Omnitrophica bacterium]|nr:tetratricopeptide repeat protein [Candidatus Omnitrophota bacterium]
MQEEKTFVLEITRQDDLLKMSIFEPKDTHLTLKQYSQHRVEFNEIDKLCQEVTAILNKAGSQDPGLVKSLQKAAQALWDHLLSRAVKEKLKVIQPANLVLTIDEELINIPWELLYDGVNFLCLSFNLGRVVRTKSAGAPAQYRSPAHIFKMLILANPTADLKCAYQEGLNIKNQFGHKRINVRVDFKSTNIDRLYVKKNLCDYDIIHFAGHCEYDQHSPKNSGWVLSDGRFSIHDVLSMGQAASLPALIFSNACYSAQSSALGLIDPKKNYSLAAAFLFSGVRHYIGSIRKIEDSAATDFAKEFYHHLILGKAVGESVRLARIKLVKDYGIITLHWSNYLLYGDPSFILFKPKPKASKQKYKINLRLGKKWLAWLVSFSAVIGICLYLYICLPTLNPSTYYLYLKAQRLFNQGANQEVIRLAGRMIKQDPNFTDSYRLLADTYLRLGRKDLALRNYFDYALLAEKKHDSKRLSSGYIEIGWFYQTEGEYLKALDFYNKALDLARKNNDKLNEAVALRKLAVWHIDKEEYDLALELLTKSAEINRERQHLYSYRYNLACDYFDFGLVFANKNDFKAAEEFYRKSQAIFQKLKLKHELSDYYFNLGEVYLFEKQYRKALDYYLRGLRIDQAQGNRLNLPSDYNMVGELYLEMERFPEAEHAFTQAVELSREVRSQPELASACHNLGLLYKKLGKKNKAKEYLRLAQEIYSSIDPLAYREVKNEILGLDNSNLPPLTKP